MLFVIHSEGELSRHIRLLSADNLLAVFACDSRGENGPEREDCSWNVVQRPGFRTRENRLTINDRFGGDDGGILVGISLRLILHGEEGCFMAKLDKLSLKYLGIRRLAIPRSRGDDLVIQLAEGNLVGYNETMEL